MFKYIVESVLNEISADDAYNKFYNFIDRKIYDDIVNANKGKFDKLVRFLLDAMKEKKIAYGDAGSILRSYNNAGNEIRMAVKKKFEKGEYSDPIELLKDIEFFEKNGVVTNKSVQEMGFGVLYDDENEKLTYTTTYEANSHYYGKTKWCTASDRMGRYDGWYYFLYYVLVRYSDINEIEYMYKNGNIKYEEAEGALFQYINKKDNKIYQLQIYKNKNIGQICDEEDDSWPIDELNMSNTVKDLMLSKVAEIAELTTQSIRKEYIYQQTKEKAIHKKKQQRNQRCLEQLKSYFEQKEAIVKQSNEKVINSNLLMNNEFMTQMVKTQRYFLNPSPLEESEEKLKTQGYFNVTKVAGFKDGLCTMFIEPALGAMKCLNAEYELEDRFFDDLDYEALDFYTYDENETNFFSSFYQSNDTKFKSAIVIAEVESTELRYDEYVITNVKRVLKVMKFDTARVGIRGCFNRGQKTGCISYTLYSQFEAIPNVITYSVDNEQYLYSLINGKTIDMFKAFGGGLDKAKVLSPSYFWCDGSIVVLDMYNDEKMGFVVGKNFNVEKVVNWCVIKNGFSNYYFICDINTGELFSVSKQGMINLNAKISVGDTEVVNLLSNKFVISRDNSGLKVSWY